MLRYKRIETLALTAGREIIGEILSCPTGRRYRIVSIHVDPLANMFLRIYKQAEQIVDIDSIAMTTAAPFLPMDVSLEVGEVCRAGFYNNTGGNTAARQITIGYTDD
jgi:hypothetical protein